MSNKAFTLIELLVVIAIIGILASFIIVSMGSAQGAASDARRKADINQLSKAILIYKTNNPDTTLPIDPDGCTIGGTCSDNSIFGSASVLRDPNGSYYSYESADGVNFTITSRLSNANNYSFDSSTGLYSENTPITTINGTCGTDNDTVTLSTPTNTCSTGTPSTVTTDPNTVLLMHMDGTDNGTTFNDQTGKTVTRYGDTKTIIATKKFGSASAYFDGNGDYLSLADSEDWNLTASKYTIDGWFYFNTINTRQNIIQKFASGSDDIALVVNPNNIQFAVYQATYKVLLTTNPITFSTGRWYHIAFVKNENTGSIFLDGVLQPLAQNTFTTFSNNSAPLELFGSSRDFNRWWIDGYVDEFRMSKEVRWISDFTPPNSQYYWWNWGCSGSGGGANSTCGANKYQ
ncbi:MAG: prepilin-type N-terminal cleavage/methylation domain-containing protein [Candidatus Pacebacteria bacterium]|nr:prepilin-type N-terminal cleavage/methylation domain-containing protein [Candidatus Paceibacterota bacterium]